MAMTGKELLEKYKKQRQGNDTSTNETNSTPFTGTQLLDNYRKKKLGITTTEEKTYDESLRNTDDFEHYSKLGSEAENPEWKDTFAPLDILGWKPLGEGQKPTNMVTFAEQNSAEAMKSSANALRGGGSSSEYTELINLINTHMKDEEKAEYNYYLGKGDTERADAYLKTITDILRQREAGNMVEQADDTAYELVFSAVAGFDQFASGVRNLDNFAKGTEADPTTAIQYAHSTMASDNVGLWKVANDLTSTTANMLPTILVSTLPVVGQGLGLATMGASVVGNSYAEMRNLGYDENQSRNYAVLVGAAETGLQALLGGFSKLGGKYSLSKGITNLVSKFDNALARIAINVPLKMGSEGLEESLQTVLEPAFKAWQTGEEFEGAEWDEILYSGLLGALSAGVMEGAPIIIGEANRSISAKNAYGTPTAQSALLDEGLKFAEGTDARKFAEKYKAQVDGGKNLSGTQLANLYEASDSQYKIDDIARIKSAAESRLAELGETGDVSKIAEVLTKQASGKKLSLTEKAVIKNSKFGQRVANELSTDNMESGLYTSAWAENIGTRRVHPEAYNKDLYDLAKNMAGMREAEEKTSVAKTLAKSESAIGTKFDASENGKTTYTDEKGNTREVAVKGVASTEGGLKVELEGGDTVKATDLSFGSNEEAIMYEMVARMEVTPDTANEIIKTFKPSNVQQATMYFASVPLAYQYGQMNYEAGLKNISLPDNQKRIVYNRGRMDAMTKAKTNTPTAKKGNTKASTATKNDGIIFENGYVYDESKANDLQRESMVYIDLITKMSNLETHVFESFEQVDKDGKKKRVAYVNGKLVSAPNGYFKDGNKIYIDINSGSMGEGAMLYTMSHEVTHYIRKWNAKGFKELGDFLIAEYGKKGVPVNALLEAQKEKIKKRYNEEKKALPGEAKLADMAYEELVADAMSDMFTDPKAYEKLAKLKQKNHDLWKKLGEAIKALLDKVKTALGIYKTEDVPVAREAFFVRGFSADAYEKLQDLYIKAFVEADTNYEAARNDGSIDLDGDENVHLFSDKSMVEGAGLQFILNEDGVNYKVLDKDGKPVKEVTAEMIVDSPLGNLVTMAKNEGFLGKGKEAIEAATKQYEFLAELVNMCINYNGIAPIWETAGTMVFSSMKSNADKQYGLTIDFSTVCKKTQAIVDAMSEAMLRLGRGLNRAEVEAIYLEVGKAGESTPCPVCYVFSRWMGIGGILDQISRFQDKYTVMSEGSLQEFIADIQEKIKETANTPDKNGKLKSKFFNAKGEISEGQVIAELKNKASNKAASALKAIANNSNVQLEIQELEALMEAQNSKDAKKTAGKIAKLQKKLVDVTALEKEMRDANDTLEEYEAYQWLTRTLMKESNGQWVKNTKFKPVPKDILFDLNKGDKFAEGYPLSWAFRTGKGASAGKAIVPYADARVGEAIQAVASQGVKDIKIGMELNPFLNSDTNGRLRILKSAIAKQARQNLIGGQRYQSTSDFRYEYGSDYLITFLEMQAIGAKVQLYTKVIEAVDFLASMGADCNLSVMPLSDGFVTLPDGTKKLVYSSVTGIDAEAAIKKSHEYNNVQLILVGISDEHIRLALEGTDVTFVIPFHGSGNSVHQIQALMNLLGENLDVTTAQDYTAVQSDHVSPNQTKEQKAMWNLRTRIVKGEAFPISIAEQALLDKNPYLNDLYRRFYLDKNADEYGIGLTSGQAEQIFPYEYWDKSLTYAEADKNGERFKEYCASMGIIPRFSGMNSKGEYVGYGDFTKNKGYWKLLIDRPMYDNAYDSDGNWIGYGKYHEQARINCSNFNVKHLDPEYGSATYGDVMSKANDPKKTNKIVDAALKQFENNELNDVRSSDNASETLFSDRVLMGSLFSGGGTLEAGLVYQMLDKEFAVEYNKKIASVYTDNHGKEHMFVGDVRDFDSKEKENVFYLHASPVCKNFSPASHSGGETTLDITTAEATARVLEEQMPQVFTVENVKRYIGSEAYNIITNKLNELGYTWDVDVYKASDYGNATKRERMIIRAVKDGQLPAKPQKVSSITSWGEATKDLWKTDLIPSNLVKSKIEAIKNTPKLKGVKLTKLDKPLLIYDTTKSKTINFAWADELAPTLTTKCGDARIIMPDGRVYAPTPKFMGRIQGLPDNYKYPKATTNAFKIIGNGIPTQLTKAVMGGVLDSAYEQTHDGEVLYSDRVTDQETLDFLNEQLENGEVTEVYRAMTVDDDENLYPPMAGFVRKNGKKIINGHPSVIGEWEQSTESIPWDSVDEAFLIENGFKHFETPTKDYPNGRFERDNTIFYRNKNGDWKAKFHLDKDNGSTVDAAYAPYIHTSLSVLNDQFTSAYTRENLVVVRGYVPNSEVDGIDGKRYQANFADKPVGKTKWHSGVVAAQMPETRTVILSRYFMPIEIVDDSVVAQKTKEMMKGNDIEIPYNVITPRQRRAMEAIGIRIGEARGLKDAPKKADVLYSDRDSIDAVDMSNGVTFNGKPFWIAMVNQRTGKIEKTWTYAEADSEGFDLNIYEDVTEEDGYVFVTTDLLTDDGRIEYDDYGNRLSDRLIEKINEQISVEQPKKELSLTERLRELHDEIGTLNKRLTNVTKWIDGARDLLEQRANNTITYEEYKSRLREDKYYRQLDDERISLQNEMDELIRELEKAEGKPWKLLRSKVLYGIEGVSNSDISYSERDTDVVSNRTLLANALESVAQNDIEKTKLNQYKSKIALIEAEQKKLAEIRAKAQALRTTKGRTPDETKTMRELDAEATQIANRINTYDKQLLNLESTKAIKNVLEREKAMLRKKLEQKGKQALKDQRQKDAATVREVMTRYQEARKKAIEGRHKTEIRHKIKNVVSDLNKLLLNPTPDKHVPIGLQLPVAEALDAINMDTMNAAERVAYYNDLIAKSSDPDEIEMLTKKRDFFEYRDANFKERITALKNAYAEFKESDDPLIRNAHNDAIADLIKNTADAVGNKSLKDMSLAQLEAVHNMYKAILATVRNANKMFKEGRQETVTANSETVKNEVKEVGGHKDRVLKIAKFFKKFGWNMLKPVTAMKVIGSKTFEKLFANVRAGEDTWAVDVNEAKQFYEGVSNKYGFNKWDFKKRYSFKDSAGTDFSLSLEQIMSLYAYSKRAQADKHLEVGGFIFDDAIEVTEKSKFGIPLKYEVNDANPYKLKKEDLIAITDTLTQEQRAFIDEMQTYLSDVMGDKGNEVSLAMYDIKLYTEKTYFPLKTSKYFREFDPEKSGTPKIKNSGFSKKTLPQAGNPIVLSNFMDVWAGHVNDMSMYHAFVLPLEDFMRVYNYSSTIGGYDSVQQYIKNAYGAEANQYIERLMDELNGGARVDPSAGIMNKGLALFKRASTLASASVVVQQPSAIARAMAYINPKYFATSSGSALNLKRHKEVWAEVKKYAPVAVIKEMGYFDIGMGKSTVEWIKGNRNIKDKIDDVLSFAPAMADELSWSYIWLAIKNEIQATTNLKVGSEEFLKKVGERFTEVITNTQVYDSVLSRSGMMRSKDTGMKMATAFMAEPTTTVNMMVDGIVQGKRGNKKFTAATVGAISASVILNSILVALVYAARDDDEDETYTEKYIGSVTSELLDGFNPLTYIPFVKDAWSIAQGYDIERSDMSVISNLWESIESLFNEDKSGLDKVLEATGAVSSIFGIPLKNLIKDGKGMYNLTKTIIGDTETTKGGIENSIEDSFKSSIPLWDRIVDSNSKSDNLYDAIISGDSVYVERLKKSYKDNNAYETALRKALRENDPRIKEAAQARLNGDISTYTRIAKEIIGEGNFSQDNVVGAINAEMTAIKKGESTEEEPTEEKDEVSSIYNGTDINAAFDNGDTSTALAIIDDLIETKVANGMEEKNAKSSVRSSMTSYWKPLYKEAYQSGNTTEMARIRQILYTSGLYGTANDVVKTTANWLKD